MSVFDQASIYKISIVVKKPWYRPRLLSFFIYLFVNMKALALLFLIVAHSKSFGQCNYIVKGHLLHPAKNLIYLIKYENGENVMDSVRLTKNGDFLFKGKMPFPEEGQLVMMDTRTKINLPGGGYLPPPFLKVFFTGDTVFVDGDADHLWTATVYSNGLTSNEREYYRTLSLQNEHYYLTEKRLATDTVLVNETANRHLMDSLDVLRDSLGKAFIKNNPSSIISFLQMQEMAINFPIDEQELYYYSFSEKIKVMQVAKNFIKRIKRIKASSIGGTAPLFSAYSLDGKKIRLADMKGRYVLLDFWGTWCGPCRESHPHIVELFKKYHSVGLEVIGIDYENLKGERAKQVVLKAIKNDKMTWPQIMNTTNNNIVNSYVVDAYPTRILIDKNGKIIVRSTVETKMLDEKLAGIFR